MGRLYDAIQDLTKDSSLEGQKRFALALQECLEEDEWIYIPADKDPQGFRLVNVMEAGKTYTVAFAGEPSSSSSSHTVHTSIKIIFQSVFAEPAIDGIVFDPETTRLFIEKRFLVKSVLHGVYSGITHAGSELKEWGNGIPAYNEEDIMGEGELLNFAMQIVINYDKSLELYEPISACDDSYAAANLIYEKDGKFIFIKVKGCNKHETAISEEEVSALNKYATLFNADSYAAVVEFIPSDVERSDAGLMLRGDRFYANYTGLKSINTDVLDTEMG